MYSSDDGFWIFLFICAIVGVVIIVVEAFIHLHWI